MIEVDGLTGEIEAVLVADGRGGTAVERLWSTGALAARPTRWGLYVVSAAAHPVGSDRTRLDLEIGPGGRAEIRSTGATLARRGRIGHECSTQLATARVQDDATMQWLVGPAIAAAGATHVSRTTVELAPGARLAWREEVVLGRVGEATPGSWITSIDLSRAGRALLATEVGLGPASATWPLASVLGGALAFCELLLVDPARDAGSWPALVLDNKRARAMSSPLGGPGVLLSAWGGELGDCRLALWRLLGDVGRPKWLADDAVWGDASAAPAP